MKGCMPTAKEMFIIQVYNDEHGLWQDTFMGSDFYHVYDAYKLAIKTEPEKKLRFVNVFNFEDFIEVSERERE